MGSIPIQGTKTRNSQKEKIKTLAGSDIKNTFSSSLILQSLGQEDPLEKETAIHSSSLAWEIPWTEVPGGLPTMGLRLAR